MIRSIVFGFLLLGSSAWADTFRAHYSIRGSGRNVAVHADSSGEARRTVMDMFPGALVTGVHGRFTASANDHKHLTDPIIRHEIQN